MKTFLQVTFLTLLTTFYSAGQVSMTLVPELNGIPNQLKANIFLVNKSNKDVALAGQNYRLYYNSKSAKFTGDITTNLPGSYTKIQTVQHFYDQDASGYGNISFERNLGFINLACDYNLETINPVLLKPQSEALIFSLIFQVSDISDFEIIWAENGVTDGYATAFNELAQVEADTLNKLWIADLSIDSGFNKSFELVSDYINSPVENIYQTSTSGINDRSLKMPNLDATQGQFVIIGQCSECNKKLKQLNIKELLLFENNVVYRQVEDKVNADRFFRQFKNMGFSNVKIYKVNTLGSLEPIKTN
jgi:hypothetical protein